MRKLIVILMAIAPFCVNSQQIAKSLTASDGSFVGFLEYKPLNYQKSGPKYPLIIFLHGIGERGNGKSELNRLKSFAIPKMIDRGNKMRFTVNGKTETFLVLSPQLPRSRSSWTPIYVEALISYAIKNLNVDPDRIHLTGLSMGGGGVWRFASSSVGNVSKLASIAPICGTCLMSNAKTIADAGLPVWGFHAQNDNVVGVSCTINAINNINKNNPGTKAQMTLYGNGGHGIWDRAYDVKGSYHQQNLFEWFLLQNRRNGANRLPVAQAGTAITIKNDPGTVTLNGTASDPDGSVTKVAWKKLSGPSGGSISNANVARPTITGLRNTGTYKYELTVIDNRGGWAISSVSIKVVRGQETVKAPQAKAGADQTITLPDNNVTLDGSESFAENGNIQSFRWTKISGANVSISNGNKAVATISGLAKGSYRFKLTVIDDNGKSASDELLVVVKAAAENRKPVANAGGEQTITLPQNSVTLDGSESSDPDGSIREYRWTKLNGPNANIKSTRGSSTVVANMAKGSYLFQLKVTDNKGAYATANVRVTVKESAGNRLPVAVTSSSESIREPASTVNLEGDKSHDPDGNIVSYSWSIVSGSSAAWIEKKSNKNTRIRALKKGTYVVRLTVKDNQNAIATADKTIVVSDRNGSNIIESKQNLKPIANAGSNQQLTQPVSVMVLNGNGSSDPDGSIRSYQWKKISGPSLTIRDADKAMATVSNPLPGTYIFELAVTDNEQASSVSRVTITVKKASGDGNQNQLPLANAGNDASIREPATTVNLVGEKSKDPDGTIVRYQWKIVSGASAAWIENASSKNTRIRALKAGTYIVQLEVQDNDQAVSTARKTITVTSNHSGNNGNNNESNLPDKEVKEAEIIQEKSSELNADAGNDITIAEPANSATLFGENSRSNGASIIRYEWKKVSGGSAAWIENARNKTTRIRSLKAGKYVLRLTVTDSKNRTSSDDMVITVNQRRSENSKEGISGEIVEMKRLTEKTSVFPNPAVNHINIRMSNDLSGKGTIHVYDVSGKMVQGKTIVKNQVFLQERMELNQLRPGIYMVEIRIGNSAREVIRFVKQ